MTGKRTRNLKVSEKCNQSEKSYLKKIRHDSNLLGISTIMKSFLQMLR